MHNRSLENHNFVFNHNVYNNKTAIWNGAFIYIYMRKYWQTFLSWFYCKVYFYGSYMVLHNHYKGEQMTFFNWFFNDQNSSVLLFCNVSHLSSFVVSCDPKLKQSLVDYFRQSRLNSASWKCVINLWNTANLKMPFKGALRFSSYLPRCLLKSHSGREG